MDFVNIDRLEEEGACSGAAAGFLGL